MFLVGSGEEEEKKLYGVKMFREFQNYHRLYYQQKKRKTCIT